MIYYGYSEIEAAKEELVKIYQDLEPPFSMKENEYLIVVNESKPDYFVHRQGKLTRVKYPTLDNVYNGQMKPRNSQQYCAMDLLKNRDIPLKLITGRFGSGKSMMCITAALEALDKNQFEKIIFVRNNVQVKDTDQIGALPGEIYDKTLPYLMPFADHCGGVEGIKFLIDKGKLEVVPLGFLRGRSIRNAIIYSMESENLTKEHIQLLMGRVDEGSELWLDGDIKQRDRIAFEKSKGLETMVERLAGHKFFGYVDLPKSERSEVSRMADLLD